MPKNFLNFLFLIPLCLSISCNKTTSSSDTDDETAQSVGDVAASIDESGGSSGSLAYLESARKTFAKYAPSEGKSLLDIFIQPSAAETCGSSTFGTCSSSTITRSFNSCTTLGGLATFTGTVVLTFSNASCVLNTNGNMVTRVPSFAVTGRRGASLVVTPTKTTGATSTGQTIVRVTAGNYTFSNDGITRKFTSAAGTVLYNRTTETTSVISITGQSRASRVLSGGGLKVTNNLNNSSITFVPSAVTYSATCNCPVSGQWDGTDSSSQTVTVKHTGCGTVTYTEGTTSFDVTLDRCYGI